MHAISYHAPHNLDDAIALMAQHPQQSRYLAGGTDLYLALEHALPDVHTVIDLKRIPGLAQIEQQADGGWRIGALTPMADIEAHAELVVALPALAAAVAVVGGPPVRSRATVGGNLCNASPAADASMPLLALGATVSVQGPRGTREMALMELFAAPRRTTLAVGEVLTAVLLPAQPTRSSSAFQRLTRSAMDIALVNAAARVVLDARGKVTDLTVALGAVGPTPVLVPGLAALHGRSVDDAALEQVAALARAAAKPIDDVRASASYRLDTVGTLAARAVRDAASQANKH